MFDKNINNMIRYKLLFENGKDAMKPRNALLIFLAVLVLTGLFEVNAVSAENSKLELLGDQLSILNNSLVNGEYGKVWELKTPKKKSLQSKEEFVAYIEANFRETTLILKFSIARLIEDNVAISRSFFTIVKNSGNDERCEEVLWVWTGNNWNSILFFPCAEEITVISDRMLPLLLEGELN